MEEKLAIVSPKVQTTRHRVKGILSEKDYQIIFSDTPGIIDPKYKLHERMMRVVKNSLEDADIALLLVDINDDWTLNDEIFMSLNLKVPAIVFINKTDTATHERVKGAVSFFEKRNYCKKAVSISALNTADRGEILNTILQFLPLGERFYQEDELSDLPTKFFVGELIREKIFELFQEEIPYHSAVVVPEYKEKSSLIKIRAEIIVHRETQKAIILGEGGKMIKKLGSKSREEIEKFVGHKVFLELFVKVKPNWRENELQLNEYGY